MNARKHCVKLSALALAGVMTLSALPARAAEYADLDENHWAYGEMTRAVGLGILQGVGNDQLAPALTMSWGQFLALVTRTFAPDDYQSALDQGAAWDEAGYLAAASAGILRSEDGLAVGADRLGAGISREDAAVLLYRALPEEL
ncbi:MAG TPA: S-layer homology domain-containing protein, partial [Candidatus Flavonifractor intestinigallinarum]|nr:S-layer homology domain-containing protein [Candidatus Flavonifractor intestinigallinarum]